MLLSRSIHILCCGILRIIPEKEGSQLKHDLVPMGYDKSAKPISNFDASVEHISGIFKGLLVIIIII